MKLLIAKDYDELSTRAATLVIETVKQRPVAVLGLATGATPLGMYANLVQSYARLEISFTQVRTFNLDDYVGLPRLSPDSFYQYMHRAFFSQTDVRPENIYLLDGTAHNLTDECVNYERYIEEVGGIDLQIVGIGRDGHLGFCEPGTSFESKTFVAKLTESTRQANAGGLQSLDEVPKRAITMVLSTIMSARKILLLANGQAKTDILRQALYGPVTEAVPASILQRHPDCTVILDALAAGE